MTLKSRSVTAIIIGIILIVVAILIWANQTGKISMFASEENTAAKAGSYDQLLAQAIEAEKKAAAERSFLGKIKEISTEKIKIAKIENGNETDEKEYTVTDETVVRKPNDEGEFMLTAIESIEPDSSAIIWLSADDKNKVERIDLF